eukprot:6095770-Pyramimonas_sp.AAC.1
MVAWISAKQNPETASEKRSECRVELFLVFIPGPKSKPHEMHLEIQNEIIQDTPSPSYGFPNEIRSAMLAP